MVVLDACCTDPSHTRVHAHPLMHTHTEIKTDTQTQIFPLTAADASRHVFTFPPWFNSATATGHQLIVSLCVCLCVDYMVLSKLLRNIQRLRLRASARVCVCVCIIIISHECQRRQAFVVFARLSRAGNCQHCAAPIDAQHARALP